ncbi:response regulator transcription factor [Priestia megaterium]|uniref:response regulator transcription factor n=1 Tax=Priestia megaterium TaxID=1404 RepID=UPI001D95CE97|nr:response regulator transcription factor [Priestia megaterium]CAH0324297.1 Transcriptional regulatory protein WalR [Priestia megaterium]
MEPKILLVDDNEEILRLLTVTLRKENLINIFTASSSKEAVDICKVIRPHIIILDVMLPDRDGFETCRELRDYTDAPIIFLTAKNTDLDKLTGFNFGGDDYVTKPFNPLEIVARIKAQLKRLNMNERSKEPIIQQVYHYTDFSLYVDSAQLVVRGIEVECPAKEFQLLCFLCEHPNKIFTKNQLYEHIWGMDSYGDTHTVMVHIRRLREKIEKDPSDPKIIVTVRGLGYKLIGSELKR